MGLFFDVLSAINNPGQQASVGQLDALMGSVQQLANSHGIEPSAMETILSGLGSSLRPALQQQATTGGLGGLLGQLGAGSASGGLLSSLLTPQLQQQLVQMLTQRTGISAGVIQSLLPSLIPIVVQLLNMGSSTDGPAGGLASITSNPLLRSFLDSDNDQDVDLGDVFKFAGRFLNAPA